MATFTFSKMARSALVGVVTLALSLGTLAPPALAADSDIAIILEQTNAARVNKGLPALRQSTAVSAVAQAWAEHMAASGSMVHNPDYSKQIPAGWSSASENIAYGYSSSRVVDAWLNSPGHYRNIMSASTDIGIGYAVDGAGTAWYVQNFASYSQAPDGDPRVTRLAGAGRFETSAAISRKSFMPGVPVAYIASAWNFPDALSGAPAAGMQGGPVLLVSSDGIPAVIAEELKRLRPQRVVVLGGDAVVSEAVKSALGSYTDGGVKRVSGAGRFETSAAISRESFSPGVSVVYLASAWNFPDALSGAPVAGVQDGPILLVDKDSVPAVIQEELKRLNPRKIVALGGPAVITDQTLMSINMIGEADLGMHRIGGDDRFATSAAISTVNFGTAVPVVFIASAWNFPDALSGASAAAAVGAPVLLVSGDSIPAAIGAELDRLNPQKIVVLGGTSVVSEAVERALVRFLP